MGRGCRDSYSEEGLISGGYLCAPGARAPDHGLCKRTAVGATGWAIENGSGVNDLQLMGAALHPFEYGIYPVFPEGTDDYGVTGGYGLISCCQQKSP